MQLSKNSENVNIGMCSINGGLCCVGTKNTARRDGWRLVINQIYCNIRYPWHVESRVIGSYIFKFQTAWLLRWYFYLELLFVDLLLYYVCSFLYFNLCIYIYYAETGLAPMCTRPHDFLNGSFVFYFIFVICLYFIFVIYFYFIFVISYLFI